MNTSALVFKIFLNSQFSIFESEDSSLIESNEYRQFIIFKTLCPRQAAVKRRSKERWRGERSTCSSSFSKRGTIGISATAATARKGKSYREFGGTIVVQLGRRISAGSTDPSKLWSSIDLRILSAAGWRTSNREGRSAGTSASSTHSRSLLIAQTGSRFSDTPCSDVTAPWLCGNLKKKNLRERGKKVKKEGCILNRLIYSTWRWSKNFQFRYGITTLWTAETRPRAQWTSRLLKLVNHFVGLFSPAGTTLKTIPEGTPEEARQPEPSASGFSQYQKSRASGVFAPVGSIVRLNYQPTVTTFLRYAPFPYVHTYNLV